ncbi:MAG: restriction endonuclease subunit S [Treponema sp.]|uniref:restriction endonuclease subunit S n=1 Tax=Treponema sp. TaxID=166 RepID=UPI001D5F5DB3|nr:restriction endonuclease subunit S [Treponema sp.]MBS7309979.1 restriction endonuclease subunit S [Treponema sp.]
MDFIDISKIAEIICGFPFQSEYFNTNGDGTRLVRGMNVTKRNLRWGEDSRWWNDFSVDLSKYQLQENDIVIGMDGSLVGKNYAKISKEDLPLLLVQRVACIRAKSNADQKFLWHCIANSRFEKYIESVKTGTTIPHISQKQISQFQVPNLPLSTQQKIAQILSSLDDKIELNNKINANLEQQAQALFKSWFVDFEPFCGEMPAGWKVGTIGDLCSTVSQTYKGNDSEVVLINTSDVENGDILNHESVANTNLKGQFKKTFQRNDILYSEIRPANRHYAFVDIDETCNYIASTKLMVIRPNEDVNPHYLYHILTNPELIKEMQHLAETRSGTFPQITFESELSTYQIPLLPKEEQDKLGNLFEKIDNMVFHNIRENKKLSNLRETLLPKLMNGEIEV